MATKPRRSSGQAKKATPKRGARAGSDPLPPDAPAKPTKPAQPRKAASATPARKRAAPSKGGAAASDKTLQAGKSAIRGAHNPETPRSTRGPATKTRGGSSAAEHSPSKRKAAGSNPAPRSKDTPAPPAAALTVDDGPLDPETGLTPRLLAFAQEYMRDLNGTAAYLRIHPDVKVTTASTESWRILRNPKVRVYLAAARKRLEVEVDFTKADLVRELVAIATADPSEISQLRNVSCNGCWPDLEPEEDLPIWQEPNPSCPRCQGDGIPRAYFADTRKLSLGARRLFQAVHVTKEGMKVVLRDQDAALEKLAKILGAYELDNQQKSATLAEAMAGFLGQLHQSGAGRLTVAPSAARAPQEPPKP